MPKSWQRGVGILHHSQVQFSQYNMETTLRQVCNDEWQNASAFIFSVYELLIVYIGVRDLRYSGITVCRNWAAWQLTRIPDYGQGHVLL